jgi:hypothetical protein
MEHKLINTVDLLILARYRDRTASVTKLWSQISHPNRILFTVNLKLKHWVEVGYKRV